MDRLASLSEEAGERVGRRTFVARALGGLAGVVGLMLIPGRVVAACGIYCTPICCAPCSNCANSQVLNYFSCHNNCDGSNEFECVTKNCTGYCLSPGC